VRTPRGRHALPSWGAPADTREVRGPRSPSPCPPQGRPLTSRPNGPFVFPFPRGRRGRSPSAHERCSARRRAALTVHSRPPSDLPLSPFIAACASSTRLLVDARGVDTTRSYHPICASCLLLEALLFQEPYNNCVSPASTLGCQSVRRTRTLGRAQLSSIIRARMPTFHS